MTKSDGLTRVVVALALAINAVGAPRLSARSADIHDWQRVRSLKAGQLVSVIDSDSSVTRGMVAVAQADALVVVLAPPAVPNQAYKRLASVMSRWPDALADVLVKQLNYPNENLSIGPSGFFVDDVKVSQIDGVVRSIARDTVTAVDRIDTGSHKGAIVGALIGVGVGLFQFARYVGTALSDTRCQPSCPSAAGAIATGVAAATIGSIIGSHKGSPSEPEPIYRRP